MIGYVNTNRAAQALTVRFTQEMIDAINADSPGVNVTLVDHNLGTANTGSMMIQKTTTSGNAFAIITLQLDSTILSNYQSIALSLSGAGNAGANPFVVRLDTNGVDVIPSSGQNFNNNGTQNPTVNINNNATFNSVTGEVKLRVGLNVTGAYTVRINEIRLVPRP